MLFILQKLRSELLSLLFLIIRNNEKYHGMALVYFTPLICIVIHNYSLLKIYAKYKSEILNVIYISELLNFYLQINVNLVLSPGPNFPVHVLFSLKWTLTIEPIARGAFSSKKTRNEGTYKRKETSTPTAWKLLVWQGMQWKSGIAHIKNKIFYSSLFVLWR